MVIAGTTRAERAPRYAGLRLSADEYLGLPDDGHQYELINGVVLMSPSASFEHQRMAGSIYEQMAAYVRRHRLGTVVYEMDVRLDAGLVYRPDLMFFPTDKAARIKGKPDFAPDLIVELLSPGTRAMDLRTKRDDYERHGVREYWAVGVDAAWKFVLRDGSYTEEEVKGDRLASEVIAGFVLDLRVAREGLGAG